MKYSRPRFVTHTSWCIITKYHYHLGRTMLLLQKDSKIEKKLYSEKDKPFAFEKHQSNQTHSSSTMFTLPSGEYGKVPDNA